MAVSELKFTQHNGQFVNHFNGQLISLGGRLLRKSSTSHRGNSIERHRQRRCLERKLINLDNDKKHEEEERRSTIKYQARMENASQEEQVE